MTQPGGVPNFAQLAQNVNWVLSQQNGMSAALRKAQEDLARLNGMADVIRGLDVSKMSGGGGGGRANGPMSKIRTDRGDSLLSIDMIPGRCYPYEATCDIAIDSNSTSQAQATITINMDGPFVAVGRYAVFRSNYTFMVSGADATYLGRSNGRFRPISSAQDTADALRAFDQLNQYQQPYVGAVVSAGAILPVGNPAGIYPTTGAAAGSADLTNMLPNFPGTGRPLVASPFNASPFRTMSFDGLIAYETLGSQFRRQWNQQGVPSHFWDTVKEMGCFDVFEPNDVVQIRATPLHPMNPEFGNIQGLGVINPDYGINTATGGGPNNPFPVGNWPWISSQYDGHEGINGETLTGDYSENAVDRITRLPDGVLTIGFWGYKICQAPGVAL